MDSTSFVVNFYWTDGSTPKSASQMVTAGIVFPVIGDWCGFVDASGATVYLTIVNRMIRYEIIALGTSNLYATYVDYFCDLGLSHSSSSDMASKLPSPALTITPEVISRPVVQDE